MNKPTEQITMLKQLEDKEIVKYYDNNHTPLKFAASFPPHRENTVLDITLLTTEKEHPLLKRSIWTVSLCQHLQVLVVHSRQQSHEKPLHPFCLQMFHCRWLRDP